MGDSGGKDKSKIQPIGLPERNQRKNALFTLCLCSFVPQCLTKRKIKNKANLPDAQMNVRSFQERDYDDFAALRRQKNKANLSLREQSQFRKSRMDVSYYSKKPFGCFCFLSDNLGLSSFKLIMFRHTFEFGNTSVKVIQIGPVNVTSFCPAPPAASDNRPYCSGTFAVTRKC